MILFMLGTRLFDLSILFIVFKELRIDLLLNLVRYEVFKFAAKHGQFTDSR